MTPMVAVNAISRSNRPNPSGRVLACLGTLHSTHHLLGVWYFRQYMHFIQVTLRNYKAYGRTMENNGDVEAKVDSLLCPADIR